MLMESDKNPFPKIDLLPPPTAILRFLGRLLTPLPTEAPDFMSNHYRGKDAEGEAIEAVQPELPFSTFLDRSRS